MYPQEYVRQSSKNFPKNGDLKTSVRDFSTELLPVIFHVSLEKHELLPVILSNYFRGVFGTQPKIYIGKSQNPYLRKQLSVFSGDSLFDFFIKDVAVVVVVQFLYLELGFLSTAYFVVAISSIWNLGSFLGLSQIPVFSQAPIHVLDYRWSHNLPTYRGTVTNNSY